ncbi:THO complex subunit 2 isoform X1 [Diorhabda carinulata]|uniref:THO complex subunit 2 isoform X1 n=1 Tax=Diorhabda carinulata TaxID=1163345 RepID=UPI0025A1F0CF|nr:THO complex subunit 2 isoform X1 [Diorhabda carinulata]
MAGVLNTEIWKNWEKSGKQEFIKFCIPLLKDESKSPLFNKHGKTTNIISYINELIDKGIQGIIKTDQVSATLRELVALHPDIPSIILDVLNLADAVTSQIDHEESRERSNFCTIVKDCEKFLSDKLLKERLEIDTLQEVGVLKNGTFYSKFIKVKTKLYYKQRKFNLFREECEGFSKLVTELNSEFTENTNSKDLIGIVQSLIGCFNLDPNRVLDIILESFENKPKDSKIFIPLINSYMNDSRIISEVLSTKFGFLRNNEQEIPQSLYILTAQLLQHKIIQLDDIYYWLLPEDKTMIADSEKSLKDAKEYVRKLQIISLNNKEKEDAPEENDNDSDSYEGNQKLGLCEALLLIGDWENAQTLIKRLPERYSVNYEPIASALCGLLHYIIEPLYSEYGIVSSKIPRTPLAPYEGNIKPPQAHTFLELKDIALPMFFMLGASLRYDTILLCKVVRLAKAALSACGIDNPKCSAPSGNSIYYDILSLIDITILPSLSYLDCNCCIAEDIWTLLKLYPYQIRYCLYSRWKNETYSLYPDLLRKRADSEKQIKNIMKRVSKENVKPVGRLIGKLTHCSPGFLFDYVLLQIQVYNNLIAPVVDSLKYLTNLSYDVLGFCLIESLANAEKKRVKHDSTSISSWLQSLSSFSGAVYKKYSIELSGLLQFVANQLKAQKSLDLLILKEVVQKMAGVDAAEDLTMDQLNALAGGELLKSEAGYFSQIRNTKKSSLRLKEAMAENDLAVALCLLMAQQNYCVVYRETQKNSHLKLVGKLSDQCQDTLVQFGTFLGSTMSVDEYVNKLPSIQSMLTDYHIPLEVAFFLARPMFNHAINQKYDQIRKLDPGYKKMSSSIKNQKYCEAVTEVMEPVCSSLTLLHPPRVWEDVSAQFLATFWSLTMYDLYIPEEVYQQVINKTKMQAQACMESGAKSKKEQERYQTLAEKLQDEKKKQTEHVEKIFYRLKQEKDNWFLSKSVKTAKNETITRFLQLCIFPRCTFTQIDAVYCAKFVHTIHLLKTPNFSTLLFYDRLFCDVTYSITSCTENEAMRYGRFLFAMLETVMRWHRSKEVFEKECANYPGFVTKYRKNNQHADNLDNVDYENYRHVCHKWHYKLAKAMVTCLESKEYVQIRNSLIILIKIIPHFPVLIKLSQFIEKRIEKVRDEEKNNRQDLFTLSSSYLGLLKQKNSSGQMMKEADFHVPLDKEKGGKGHESRIEGANKHNGEVKDDSSKEKKSRQSSDDTRSSSKPQIISVDITGSSSNNKTEKQIEEQGKEKRRSERNEEKEREKEKRRERREEKANAKDEKYEKQYSRSQDERYIEKLSPKDESRYTNEQMDRYYDDRGGGHYYRSDIRDDRDLLASGNGSIGRSQEAEPDRDSKRRKVDSSSKNSKHEERKSNSDLFPEKTEKRERSTKPKDKRDKMSEEEKEMRKERKLGRKRDRLDEVQLEMKRRREEDKASKMVSPNRGANGEMVEPSPIHIREKHHRTREISPYQRDRSHERSEPRDKHRRSSENKRR